ncbi:MAG: TonB-dependent receptor [Chitinophagaceae bacterium]|nr:MAG: TonB-dependent receptor [Chitinophagaceae bacterium]
MNRRQLPGACMFTILLLLLSCISYAQQRTIRGTVTNANDQAGIAGVTVTVKGTTVATSTGQDGSFSINVPASATTLVFTSVGYAAREQSIAGTSIVDLTLTPADASLEEVVVIGYGTQRRKDVTGAISKVTGENLNTIPAPSFEAALQGKAPGVQIIQGNGLAGSGSVVRIRGVGSVTAGGDPLYVLDGIPITSDQFIRGNSGAMNQNPLASINPADIESIEILKDAGATGIYGSRGANGVILITTKRGKTGKPKFNYSNRLGAATAALKPEFVNSTEWLQLRQEGWANDGRTGLADVPGGLTYAQAASNNTDWWKELTSTGFINEHNLSMSQGTKKLRSFVNLTYGSYEGYIKSNSFERLSARANIDYMPADNVKISLTTGYNRGNNHRVSAAWDGGIGDALSSALPIFPVYTQENNYFMNGANPVRKIQETKRREIDNRFIGGLSFEWQVIKNLYVRANGSIEYTTAFDDIFESANWINQPNKDSGYAKRNPYWGTNKNGNVTVNYLKKFGNNHSFNFLLGTEAQEYVRKKYRFEIGDFASEGYWNNVGDYRKRRDQLVRDRRNQNPPQPTEIAEGEYTFNSFFGRINYSYKERYAFQVTARMDGSSKFGQNNRHGFFPAASAAWTISEEKFMEKYEFINFLKLRASYGVVGNANIAAGRYYPNFAIGGVNYNGSPTAYLNSYGNPDLKWERLNNIDAAVEFSLFNSRLTGEVAYYHKITTSTIMEPGLSLSNGVGNVLRNLYNSKILNEGYELSLNYKVINKKDFTWSIGGNISKNYNEVLDWELGPDVVSGGTNDTRIVKGLPIGVNYLVRYHGVDPSDGLPIWLDKDGKQTKTFSLDHRVYAGSVMPDYMGGFNTALQYKGFELSSLFTFVVGGNIYDNSGKYQFLGTSKKNWNFRRDFLDRWTEPGDIAKYPRLTYDAALYPGVPSEDQFNSTMFLHDASYLRMRELTIGYRVPQNMLRKWKLNMVRVYVTGSNLLTFTKYSGGDPEITRDFENPQDRNLSPNITYLTAPTQRTVVFGLNVGF